jgi:2-oxoglutarate dehydrogenase E2 component (dihydrolipoamide succinyltransferase)
LQQSKPAQTEQPSTETKPTPVVETKPIVEVKVVSEPVQEIKTPEIKKISTPVPIYDGDEVIEMDRMRKMIAQRMVESKHTAPHVTSFVEADVTNLVYWRRKVKDEMLQREGETLTFMPMFVEAIVKALKDYPMMNVSVDGDKIIKRKNINIGMAVALPSGNLIVPVIHNADQLNLVGLTKKINDLARRARENKLKPDELIGGTYTVSNVGSFGNVLGTPIIMQPQVGILALGAIRKQAAVIETPFGDTIGVRHMMFLSHSYDHRVVDGSLGGMFVRRVADYLEDYDLNKNLF